MIHQPLGGATGQATDIEIQALEIIKIKEKMTEILAHHTGKSVKEVSSDIDRDSFTKASVNSRVHFFGFIEILLSTRK